MVCPECEGRGYFIVGWEQEGCMFCGGSGSIELKGLETEELLHILSDRLAHSGDEDVIEWVKILCDEKNSRIRELEIRLDEMTRHASELVEEVVTKIEDEEKEDTDEHLRCVSYPVPS